MERNMNWAQVFIFIGVSVSASLWAIVWLLGGVLSPLASTYNPQCTVAVHALEQIIGHSLTTD